MRSELVLQGKRDIEVTSVAEVDAFLLGKIPFVRHQNNKFQRLQIVEWHLQIGSAHE